MERGKTLTTNNARNDFISQSLLHSPAVACRFSKKFTSEKYYSDIKLNPLTALRIIKIPSLLVGYTKIQFLQSVMYLWPPPKGPNSTQRMHLLFDKAARSGMASMTPDSIIFYIGSIFLTFLLESFYYIAAIQ